MPFYEYPRVSLTATVVLLHQPKQGFREPRILIGRRSLTVNAFPGAWCLPGGHCNVDEETAEDAALREVDEECGVRLSVNELHQFWTCTDPKVDPRGHYANVCFYAYPSLEDIDAMVPGDDIVEHEWVHMHKILDWRSGRPLDDTIELAFNHNHIVQRLAKYLKLEE